MLRSLRASDVPPVLDLVVAAGLFTEDEAGFLVEVLTPLTAAGPGAGEDGICLVEEREGALAAVVYYRPEQADRLWDLTMIAVGPALQGRGLGRAVMQHVEHDLLARGARMLAVRTSGTARYESTRTFYERCGYDRVAQVADWWTDGDDLVLFTKRLMARTP